jgi:hypothetical protein
MPELSAKVGKGVGAGLVEPAAGIILASFCFYGVLLASGITIRVLFLLPVLRCLTEIPPRTRGMEPVKVAGPPHLNQAAERSRCLR